MAFGQRDGPARQFDRGRAAGAGARGMLTHHPFPSRAAATPRVITQQAIANARRRVALAVPGAH